MEIRTDRLWADKEAEIQARIESLSAYRDVLGRASVDATYARHESALYAPSDTAAVAEVTRVADELREKAKLVLVVGIGGSDLGARAVYEALTGHRAAYTGEATPALCFFEGVEPSVLARMEAVCARYAKPEDVVLVVISKSGGTIETLTNAETLYGYLAQRYGKEAAARQTVVIGDPSSPLLEKARGVGMRTLTQPSEVGGRFSVFTATGLLPLALAGVDVATFLSGAERGVHSSVRVEGPSSAARIAVLLAHALDLGLTTHELFVFNPELETLGKWYRQLLAESIGKTREDGVRVGLEPSVAVGSTDLHSLGQLIFGGPQRRITTFVAAPSVFADGPVLESDSPFMTPALRGTRLGAVPEAIYRGVLAAYEKNDLPHLRIELADLSVRELGAFMAVQMASVMYLGKLLGVDTFDQPAVEGYKEETRRILAS